MTSARAGRVFGLSQVVGAILFVGSFVLSWSLAHAQSPQSEKPGIPPATLDDGLEVSGDDLAAARLDTRMSLPVLVNDLGPFRFVVDSGADRSVVGRAVAERLGLAAGRPVRLTGVVETATVPTVRVDSLSIGANRITGLELPALLERHLGADGLIGIDALSEQRLMLDFERSLVRIEDGRRRVPWLPGDIVVTARRQKGQLIITEVAASGRRALAVIDSGAMLSVGNTALLRDIQGRRRAPPVRAVEITGVTGAKLVMPMAIVPELRIGPLRLLNVPIAFADLPPFARFGLSEEPAILLGTDALQAFAKVSLDFKKRKVRFQLRRREGTSLILN